MSSYSIAYVRAVARVLKARFTNLSVEETLTLAADILDAIKAEQDKERPC